MHYTFHLHFIMSACAIWWSFYSCVEVTEVSPFIKVCICSYGAVYWGEPERAPHVRVVQRVRLYIYIYIYIYIYRMAGNFGGEFILADWRF